MKNKTNCRHWVGGKREQIMLRIFLAVVLIFSISCKYYHVHTEGKMFSEIIKKIFEIYSSQMN